jgi:hypothetical protein
MRKLYINFEVGIMSSKTSLEYDQRIQKSIQALRGLGLRLHLERVNDDWIYIAIDRESIINAIRKIAERNIRWTQYLILNDTETGYLTIHFWRGDIPSQLKMKLKI